MRDSIIKIVRRETERGRRVFRFYIFFIGVIISAISIRGVTEVINRPAIEKIVINQFESRNIDEYLSLSENVCGIDISQYRVDLNDVYLGGDKLLYRFPNNLIAKLTLRPDIQKILKKNLAIYNIPFVAAVVMEADSGKIIGLYEKKEKESPHSLLKAYRSASIFKIITMETLLSEKDVDTEKLICYHGGKRRLTRSILVENPRKDYRCMKVEKALGFSANVVFARLAYRHLDREILEDHIRRFGFEEDLPIEIDVEKSYVEIPSDREGLAYTAAGFGQTYITPIHGAIIASIVANNGKYIKPTIIDEIIDNNENTLYTFSKVELRTVFSEEVATRLKEMMKITISEGTAHRFFARRGPVDFIRDVPLAGKTGSLADKEGNYTEYNWFVGFAPSDKPEYVISVISINSESISARATVYARGILNDLFSEKRRISSPRALKETLGRR